MRVSPRAAIAIPNYVRARSTMSMNSCTFNQMWIESAKRQWATVNHKAPDDIPSGTELLASMHQVTPMWATRKLPTRIPNQLPTCFLNQRPYPIGSVGHPIQCDASPDHRWDEQAYLFHYALGAR